MNTQPITFEEGLHSFTQSLTAANKSAATIGAVLPLSMVDNSVQHFLTT